VKVAIIGGSGKMGRWFARFLRQEGHEVVITGRNEGKLKEAQQQLDVSATTDNLAAVKDARAVLISVPIENFEAVVKQIGPHTEPGQVIMDVTSVKAFPVVKMHQHIGVGVVLGGHPVFGPGAKDVAYRSFILTPTSSEEEALARKVKDYLETKGARATLMSPEEHDELMAVVLGLAHFMMHLPQLAEIEHGFQEKVTEWAELVAGGDEEQFARRMKALKERYRKVAPDFGSAYEDMYRLIEVLQKPPEGQSR